MIVGRSLSGRRMFFEIIKENCKSCDINRSVCWKERDGNEQWKTQEWTPKNYQLIQGKLLIWFSVQITYGCYIVGINWAMYSVNRKLLLIVNLWDFWFHETVEFDAPFNVNFHNRRLSKFFEIYFNKMIVKTNHFPEYKTFVWISMFVVPYQAIKQLVK